MSKLTRCLLCIAAVVVLAITLGVLAFANSAQQPAPTQEPVCYEHGDVDSDGSITNLDAIYVLYHYMFEEEGLYPIEQDWDYDKNGVYTHQDAIYVMYHYMFADDPDYAELYRMEGTIHSYYEPTWTWEDEHASVSFKCGCGIPGSYNEETGVTVTAGARVEATCVEAGSATYIASVTVDGKEYTNTSVQVLPAGAGHQMIGTAGCEIGSKCQNCDYEEPAKGHSWQKTTVTEATCTQNAYQNYQCTACLDDKQEELLNTAGHDLEYLEARQDGCKNVNWYQCTDCGHTEAGTAASDTYYNHNYTATLTKEATCVSKGEKTYVCACGASYAEQIPANDSHNWVEGNTVAGVTTHECSNLGCSATKTTVAVTENTQLDVEDLTNELQLDNGAAMSLDQETVDALDANKTVVVSVTPLEEDDDLMGLLSDDQKEQIGENTVYDFTMEYSDGSAISEFAGAVTISLPYTLAEGEDVDSIDVWYIDDNGDATQVTGTYSNGFVTFTTTHFSYYTVTRLTPAQRCERYGHIMVEASKKATCTQDGYEMTLCQRCALVETEKVLTRTGHSYQETTVAATCTAAGSYKKVCDNCSHTVNGVLPKLTHELKKDTEASVAASCTAAGKDVYACSQPGCDYTRDVADAQIAHSYKDTAEVAADCTNKGYTEKTCESCGDVVVYNEVMPLGHEYEMTGWSWADDHSEATVTLTCTHDSSHTNVLSAVVTEKKESATCMGTGATTYTATASFNKITYTDSYTDTVAAIGHKPGTAWEFDSNRHYHICTVCGEKVDAVSHTWDTGTVIQEPTCKEEGSALYKCTVCAYEQEKTVPATREHTYVNGICSVCGREEGGCLHAKTTETEVDLTGYAICDGAEIIKYSCDCGENVYYNYRLACKLDYEVEPETVIIDGKEHSKYTYECEDCGLTESYVSLLRNVEDECAVEYVVDVTISFGGQSIVETEWTEYSQAHGGQVLVETVDLTTYGLCTEVLEIYECGCDRKIKSIQLPEMCNWEHQGYDGEVAIAKCVDCGAIRKTKYTYDEAEESCENWEHVTYTYLVDGEEVYSYEFDALYLYHDMQVDEYEMFGTSCEDGVYYYESCKYCGKTGEDYYEGHWTCLDETVDLSGYEFCADSAKVIKCPCGSAFRVELVYPEGQSCQMEHVEGTENTYKCTVCGVIKNEVYTEEKDENCNCWYDDTQTYTNSDGQVIIVAGSKWMETECHSYVVDRFELDGTSCEDGYRVWRVCEDCGDSYSYSTKGHQLFEVEKYDVEDYGLCGGSFVVNRCPCGENSSYWNNTNCNWEHIGGLGDEGYEESIYRCTECDYVYVYEYRMTETDDPCKRLETRTITVYSDVEKTDKILSFSCEATEEYHDMLATLGLINSDLGCAGGVEITETCQRCGAVREWTTHPSEGHHPTYLVGKEILTSDKMCGPLYVYEYACACGNNARTETWTEGCSWNWIDEYTARCESCNTVREETYTRVKDENDSCKWHEDCVRTYTNGEDLLFEVEFNQIYYRHREVFTFTMEGETCSDGYQVHGTCLNCGATTDSWDSGCYTYPLERQVIANDPNACGYVEFVCSSCPCGKYGGWNIEYACESASYQGTDQDGYEVYTCNTCAMERRVKLTSQRVPDSCQYENTWSVICNVGDNTYSGERTYTRENHTYVYDLTLQGETCADGYTMQRHCIYCDEVEAYDGVYYGHETHRTVYYYLEDYGMCGGYVHRYNCACGLESDWSWDVSYCELQNTGNIDEDTGLMEHYCSKCQSYFCWGDRGELNTDTCYFEGTFYFKLRNETETLINVNGNTSHVEHTTHIVNAVLMDPNGDCESGVCLTWQCQYCGISWEGYTYSHSTYAKQQIAVGCGGTIEIRECACGEYKDISFSEECDSFGGHSWEETDENGVVHYYWQRECDDCGLSALRDRTRVKLEGCNYLVTEKYTINNGTEVVVSESTEEEINHNYGQGTVALAPGSTSCMDGYIYSHTCQDCGYTDSWENSGYHQTVRIETIDLTQLGACSGEIYCYSCACGEIMDYEYSGLCYNEYDWDSYVGADGITYYYQRYECTECGFYMNSEYYYEDTEEACRKNELSTLTVRVGDNERTLQGRREAWIHNTVYSYELVEGAQDCNDGVRVTETCTGCGDQWTGIEYYHRTFVAESIDLSEYGSLCGASLEVKSCACGKSQYVDFSEDTQCDLDRQEIDTWIENALDDYQGGFGHSYGSYSYANLHKCAVTDPALCGLTIRMSRYWLKEGCYAVGYELWQLGYDETTGTCQREISFATGEKHSYHNLSMEQIGASTADGGYTQGYQYTCADCGSYKIDYLYTYDADGNHISTESSYVNNLADGCNRYYCYYRAYTKFGDANALTTERYDYTYSDGSTYWDKYAYTYDVENCTRTTVCTDSAGNESTVTTEYHLNETYHSESVSSTCSQPGYHHYWYTCDSCGKITNDYTSTYEPGHYWHWNSDLETYVCNICGLENDAGADGSIIMEDLTEERGNGTDYVIGYYNPEEIVFTANVTVILDDAAEDNQIDLNITDFTYYTKDSDGFTGLSFNKAAADAAAAEAVAGLGYEGAYAVRISLVPATGNDTLDYAITFDSVTAE